MGYTHKKMDELESAKKYLGLALEIQLKTCPDHPDVATTYRILGDVHCQLNDLEQAKEYQDRALAIRLKKRSPDHADVKQGKEYQDGTEAIRKGKLSDRTAVNLQICIII